MTLAEILEQRATDRPDALAFATENESLTYSALRTDAERIAAGFGFQRGDRVAIVMPVGLDLVRVFWAAQRAGAVPCIFNPMIPAATTQSHVARIRPHFVIDAITHSSDRTLPKIDTDPESLAFLQLTSGTSGEPRAAMVLQRNVLASLESARALIEPRANDVLVAWVPPWHDLGLLRFVLGPVAFGMPCHIVPPAVRTVPQWLQTIARVRGTITGAPDFAYRLAAKLVPAGSVDLRSLRYATNGGEPVQRTTIESFEQRFGLKDALRAGYGLAEATLGVTCMRSGEALRTDERGNVSTGRALDGVEVKTADDGEILVRSPAVFAGYFEDPEGTAEKLRDGWLHTGDVGALDADGHLYVLGRRRAMLKRGGAPLAPRELEEAAQTVDAVRIAAAVGLPPKSDAVSEELVVVVEADGDRERIKRDVAEAVEKAIGFAPHRVVVQPPRTIPRTPNGKIRHAMLREQLMGASRT
ncbi:MAG: AMP-binding protein [Acidobacteria bacterium]|nr:AMP-binding protein [Acidobacteriota bacterium]